MAQQLVYKTHLLIFGEGRRSTDAFYFQNQTDEESPIRDHFFLFFDSTDYRHFGKRDLKNIKDLIVSKIEKHKFQQTQNQEITQEFEKLLKDLNGLLPPLLPAGDPFHQHLSILISHIRGETVSFGCAGNPDAFFVRPKSSGDGLMLKIFEKKDPRETPSAMLFSHTVSGKISSGDILFLATPNVLDYLSQEKIKRTLLSLSPQPAAETVKSLLFEARSREKFGMIIIKAVASLPAKQSTSHHSIEEFIGKKNTTQTVLSPQMSHTIKTGFEKTAIFGKNIFRAALELTKEMFPKKSAKDAAGAKELKPADQEPAAWKKPTKEFDPFKYFPKSQKRLLWIISGLVIFFIIGIFISFADRSEKQISNGQIELQSRIKANIEQAEADILYGNENSARDKFEKISSDLKIPAGENFAKNPENKTILNRYDILKQKLFHLVSLASKENQSVPLTFGAGQVAERVAYLDKKIIVQDSSGKFYSIDADGKKQTVFSDLPEQKPILLTSAKKILAGLNDIVIEQYDSSLKKTTVKIDPLPARAIAAMNFFNDRLYLLVPDERQIYVYAKSGDAYKKTKSWVENGGELLAGAVDFAVDGEIYVLKNDGTIVKFSKNKPAEFETDAVEYQISPSKIITPAETAPLYILDKAAGRIIVFDKSGKLLTQYASEKTIIDAAVNGANAVLAILYENEIQIFNLK